MATILLSAAGAAIGGYAKGAALAKTGVILGRAAGGLIGSYLDRNLFSSASGSDPVEVGRTDHLRLTGAQAGAPIAQLYGRMRLAGQIIWATEFLETVSTSRAQGGGKGSRPAQPQTEHFAYSISVAIALCEGEIARVGRIWADGVEIDRQSLNWTLYKGSETQQPDPLMEAVEGAGAVPAYRGIAYIVIEDLDLAPFGNRVPQFSFEVVRPARPKAAHVPSAADLVEAVALMPGTGEYVLSTTPVSLPTGLTGVKSANVSTQGGGTDFAQSLGQLRDTLPNLASVVLIYSWFGDDLRAGSCSVKPKVEYRDIDGTEQPWRAGGFTRDQVEEIARIEERPVYGGTPGDSSIIEGIRSITAGGQQVTFYPFLLMEILQGSALPDPYGGAEQAPLPWRGRITGDLAPGREGSPDRTPANRAAVDRFFGSVTAEDFVLGDDRIDYIGPDENSYSRFILHSAALSAVAGGVEAICIGSEMRGLTQMRDDQGFPAVRRLIALAAEVRKLLPDAKITYAADWSEYFGYHPQDGSGDVYFHLDPLWADENIDVVAIDNYMPLSDWRDGDTHADFERGPIYDLDYLKSGIEGGEGYDWFYSGPESEAAQRRRDITDGSGKPWVYRYKDLRNWWQNQHHERRGGFELSALPVDGADFDGDNQTGTYWLAGHNFSADALATAQSFADSPFGGRVDLGESYAIEANGVELTCSERGLRPMIREQVISLSLRTRLLSDVGAGETHLHGISLALHDADGAFLGLLRVVEWAGLSPSDGWVLRSAELRPSDLIAGTPLETMATSWRLVLTLNDGLAVTAEPARQQVANLALGVANGVSVWAPRSKPIWFTEYGCAAIDKGPNQPNKFLDPKSSESSVPKHSNGRRDDLVQAQYLRAVAHYWGDEEMNPASDQYDGRMLDMSRAHVWAWDARPWPAFPNDRERWSDGENWARGHWVTGRLDAQPLDLVVAEICERAGLTHYDVSRLYGLVRGYAMSDTQTARARLQHLMTAHAFHAVERDGKLVFLHNPRKAEVTVTPDLTAREDQGPSGFTLTRTPDAETPGRLRIGFVEAEGEYDARVAEAVYPGDGSDQVTDHDLPMILTRAEAHGLAERWLAEGRVARDALQLALPPSSRPLGAGQVIETPDGHTWRIDRVEDRGIRQIDAIRIEPSTASPSDAVEEAIRNTPFVPPLPVFPVFLDLPLLTGEEVPHAPHLAVAATPWPGSVAVFDAPGEDGYQLNKIIDRRATIGRLEQPLPAALPGLWDRGAPLQIRLETGQLAAVDQMSVLAGANVAAIGSGDDDTWEIIQFADAQLVDHDLWQISARLRGQLGTDAFIPESWPKGALFVLLDASVGQVNLAPGNRGLARSWRIGPAARGFDDPSYRQMSRAFEGAGLRPYRPVHLRSRSSDTGLDLSWIRRSRLDADSWTGLDIPLGEASEAYLMRIGDAQSIRREEQLTAPHFTYTNQMRASDGTQSPFFVEVAQVSDRVGAGPFARIEIND